MKAAGALIGLPRELRDNIQRIYIEELTQAEGHTLLMDPPERY
jgi:hypothetical protein